jgi:hypothetical protein
MHFLIIFPSKPLSFKWSPSLRSPHQNLVRTSTVDHTCHMNHNIVNARMPSKFLHGKAELTSSYNCVPEPLLDIHWGCDLRYFRAESWWPCLLCRTWRSVL